MLAGRQRHALRADIAEVRDQAGVTQTILSGHGRELPATGHSKISSRSVGDMLVASAHVAAFVMCWNSLFGPVRSRGAERKVLLRLWLSLANALKFSSPGQ